MDNLMVTLKLLTNFKIINMKKTIFIILLISFISCDSSDDIAQATGEKIEVFIDGSTTPLDFSNQIVAKEFPLPPSSGFAGIFAIASEDTSQNVFQFTVGSLPSLGSTTPFVVTTPSSEILNGPISGRLTIPGITFDDAAANNITINYIQFGANTGDPIEINFSGVYYTTSNNAAHTISCTIDIVRD
jgi:hypothetical protein